MGAGGGAREAGPPASVAKRVPLRTFAGVAAIPGLDTWGNE